LDIRARVTQCQGDVRVAEEVVTALNIRVRELEESIERERMALMAARDKASLAWRALYWNREWDTRSWTHSRHP